MFLLDKHSRCPLYIQLYRQFKADILSGRLQADDKMPSIRKLSVGLNMSKNTIQNAYALLLMEGLIENKPKSGYYIKPLKIQTLIAPPAARPDETYANQHLLVDLAAEKYDDNKMPERSFVYNFCIGSRVPEESPFADWQKLTNKCFRNYKYDMSSYRRNCGEVGLRREIARYLNMHRHVDCTAEQVVIGAGTYSCVASLCLLLKENGYSLDIAMELPGMQAVRRNFLRHGARISLVPLDQSGMALNRLEETEAKSLFITPGHQFPTGTIMPIARRLELIEWVKARHGVIMENDYSQPFNYGLGAIPPLQSLAPEQVIYFGNFSKSIFPSLRISYMVLPQKLAVQYEMSFSRHPSVVPFLEQKTLELFMKEGYWEKYLKRTTHRLRKKRDCLIDSLDKEFGDKVRVYGAQAGFHVMAEINWQTTEKELIEKAYRAGVGISPLSLFCYLPENWKGSTLCLHFGGIRLEDIPSGVKRLRQAWLGGD